MATITTDNYFQAPAEAYQGIQAQFSGLQTIADGTTFAASYTSASNIKGAKLTLECDDFSGANHRVMNSWMSSIQPGCKIPVRILLSFGTLISQKTLSGNLSGIHWTIDQLMAALMPAVYSMIEDITDGTATPGPLSTFTFGSNPRPMIAYQPVLFASSNDLMVCYFAWVDQSMSANTLLQTTPLYMPVLTNGITNFTSAPSSGQDQTPLDLDVSINNAANIFSVFSRTFTEPGNR